MAGTPVSDVTRQPASRHVTLSMPWQASTTALRPTTKPTSAASACVNSGQAAVTTSTSAPTAARDRGVGVAEFGTGHQRVAAAHRVVDRHDGAEPAQLLRDLQTRRVAHVVGPGLERRAPDRYPAPRHFADGLP